MRHPLAAPAAVRAAAVGGMSLAKLALIAALGAASCSALRLRPKGQRASGLERGIRSTAAACAVFVSLSTGAVADGQTEKFKLPPIDRKDPDRCSFKSSTIGQANAARDKLYDLRECVLSNKQAEGFDLSGAIMSDADFSGTNFREAQFSKAYAERGKFDGADFTNAVVDRVSFKGASLRGTLFSNAVLTGTNFEDSDVEDADFTGAYIGKFDLKTLCKNPSLKGKNKVTGEDTYESLGGCPN